MNDVTPNPVVRESAFARREGRARAVASRRVARTGDASRAVVVFASDVVGVDGSDVEDEEEEEDGATDGHGKAIAIGRARGAGGGGGGV